MQFQIFAYWSDTVYYYDLFLWFALAQVSRPKTVIFCQICLLPTKGMQVLFKYCTDTYAIEATPSIRYRATGRRAAMVKGALAPASIIGPSEVWRRHIFWYFHLCRLAWKFWKVSTCFSKWYMYIVFREAHQPLFRGSLAPCLMQLLVLGKILTSQDLH